MKSVLIWFHVISSSYFNCIKSNVIKNSDPAINNHYTINSIPPYSKNNNEHPLNNATIAFDFVRKYYEIKTETASDSLEYSPVPRIYVKNVIINKESYTKSDESEFQYVYDSYISTTLRYIPVDDSYIDIEELANSDNEGIDRRYLLDDALSDTQTGNNMFKSRKHNIFNGYNGLLTQNGNEVKNDNEEIANEIRELKLKMEKV